MKLSKLLATRRNILRQAQLANLADAYVSLKRLGDRVAATGLNGRVKLLAADPGAERYCPFLQALEGNQSVIEEHFTDKDVMTMADAIVLAIESQYSEVEFRLEQIDEKFVVPLRDALEGAGVVMDRSVDHDRLRPEGAADRGARRKRT